MEHIRPRQHCDGYCHEQQKHNDLVQKRRFGSEKFFVKLWNTDGGGWDQWKSAHAESVPVAIAASGTKIAILFRFVPGKSGKFLVKHWTVDATGWGEWKTSVPDGDAISVTVSGNH